MIALCSLASKAHGASLAIFRKFPSRSISEKSDLSGKPRTPEIVRVAPDFLSRFASAVRPADLKKECVV